MTDITREDLLLALANSSVVRLDALGINTAGRAPSMDVLEATWGALYGSGRWGRFWKQTVHPRLFPQQHRALKMAHRAATEQVEREWMEMMDERLRAVIDDLTQDDE